jgi:outer membrane PBP1 activator LpoA protein
MKHLAASLIVLGSLLLAACTSTPVVAPVNVASREAAAEAAVAAGDFTAARDIYRQLVNQSVGDESRRLSIELARTEVLRGDPEAALDELAAIGPPIPDALRPDFMGVRADALFALGRTVEAVRERVEAGIWLDSASAVLANQNSIWQGLSLPQSRAAAGTRTGDTIIDGWLALIPLTALTDDNEAFLAALVDWRRQFGAHPAATGLLAEQLAAVRGSGVRPQRLALLLPVGSDDLRLRRRALAIRDGIFSALFSGSDAPRTDIEVFDTARGSVEAFRAAQRSGADFIVGPLLASAVDEVVVLPEADLTPTLALNVSDRIMQRPPSFYEFALSSDDEVEAIASRAIAAGQETAVILHASGARGTRIRDSFRAAFEARGGHVIDSRSYDPGGSNLSAPIIELLNISRSQSRYTRLRSDLGLVDLEFEPRRREDIDMIFLQAEPETGPENARLLVPLLARNGAAEIPTYATPEVYDPTRVGGDSDLDGIIFPDVPLLIDPVGGARTAADQLASFESRSAEEFRRLYAFGFDALRLASALFSGDTALWPISGATGQLYVGDDGRIRRVLPLAQFRGGEPQAMESAGSLLSAR